MDCYGEYMANRDLIKLRDRLLAESTDGKPRKTINMMSKRVRAVTPADRAEMVRLARDPNIRRR